MILSRNEMLEVGEEYHCVQSVDCTISQHFPYHDETNVNACRRHSMKGFQQSRQGTWTTFSNTNGLPVSKRPRVGDSPAAKTDAAHWKQPVNLNEKLSFDPFGDDECFTGEELAELEMVASQAEGSVSKQSSHFQVKTEAAANPNGTLSFSGSMAFKAPIAPAFTSSFTSSTTTARSSFTKSAVNPSDVHEQIRQLKLQCSKYQTKVDELEKKHKLKEGEAGILRDKLEGVERVLLEERRSKALENSKLKEEKSQKEMDLEKKVEMFRDQIEFKQVELKEAQSLIKNLELKNKALTEEMKMCAPAEGMASSARLSQGNEVASKRIKFVKPQSPRVPVSSSRQKFCNDILQAAPKSSTSSQEKKLCNYKFKRKVSKLLTASEKGFDDFPHSFLVSSPLHQLFRDCKAAVATPITGDDRHQLLIDCMDGMENLRDVERAKKIFQLVRTLLRENLHTAENTSERFISKSETLFEVVKILLERVPLIIPAILDEREDFVAIALSHLKQCENFAATASVFSILATLAKSSSPTHLFKFSTLPMECARFLHRTETRSLLIEAVHSSIADETVAESVLVARDATDASFLSAMCSACCVEAEKFEESLTFPFCVISLLTDMVCLHEKILIKHRSFAEIYHTLNLVLFHQLTYWKREQAKNVHSAARGSLICQCTCLLHSCSNVFADGIPGVHRDHKHLLLLWKLLEFVDAQDSDSLWCQELNKILQREIDSFENCE